MKTDDTNSFNLEELAIPETAADAKAKTSSKSGQKVAHKKGERFIMITEAQVHRLAGASAAASTVFYYLKIKELDARSSSFVLKPAIWEHLGIDRFTQLRALHDLAKRGLLLTERRGGPRKPLAVTLLGSRKTRWNGAK